VDREKPVAGAVNDLTKGYVPIVLLLTFIVPTAIYVGLYFGKKDSSSEQLVSQVTALQSQVSSLATQVGNISVAIAKPPTIPENVAFKADLLRLCVENRQLKCPQF
jgi:hypothetical protein